MTIENLENCAYLEECALLIFSCIGAVMQHAAVFSVLFQ
jgi:hypothetical protein